MEIVVIGATSFLPGFALAGVRKTILATKNSVLEQVEQHHDAGIIILDETLLADVAQAKRDELETRIKPVVIVLARDGANQKLRLRRAIMNTLGVDLLK
jgi:vacuolar-type H+-ATPase subunit F/Vma7